ncbi:MAG TPA: AI-2E family transporter [Candidatus Limnocylindrales bacterium]
MARARAAAEWSALRDRVLTITPAAAGRGALVVTVVVAVAAMIAATWPQMLPFAVGGLIAWAVLPVVDALDRVMPRPLAAVLSVLGLVALVVAVIVAILPPFALALIEFAQQIPGQAEINADVANLLAGLPDETRQIVEPILTAAASVASDSLNNSSGSLSDIVRTVVEAIPQVAGAILGLIVLPTWIVTLMSSNRRARLAVDTRLAGWLRPDFWAVVRMLDRSLRTFFKAYVGQALAVGLLMYVLLNAAPEIGGPEFIATLALAGFAGIVQLVPELGPILGFFPALLVVALDPQKALWYVVIYVLARFIGGKFIDTFVAKDSSNVHRAVVIPGVVLLSTLGPLALILSAPILGFLTDFVRYAYGRLSEPARPAGALPDEPVTARPPASAVYIPTVYRNAGKAAAANAPAAR